MCNEGKRSNDSLEHDHMYSLTEKKKVKKQAACPMDSTCIHVIIDKRTSDNTKSVEMKQTMTEKVQTSSNATMTSPPPQPITSIDDKGDSVSIVTMTCLHLSQTLYVHPGLFNQPIDSCLVRTVHNYGCFTNYDELDSTLIFALFSAQNKIANSFGLTISLQELFDRMNHLYSSIITHLKSFGSNNTPLQEHVLSVIKISFQVSVIPDCLSSMVKSMIAAARSVPAAQQLLLAAVIVGEADGKYYHNNLSMIETITSKYMSLLQPLLASLLIVNECEKDDNLIENCITCFSNDKFPVHSHVYDFLNDQFKFFLTDGLQRVRYSRSTKDIAYLIWRTCGGHVLRLLTGFKGEDVQGQPTNDPSKSNIILALPSENALRSYKPSDMDVPKVIAPGFQVESVKQYVSKSPSNTAYILKFDGRNIRPGFIDDIGDVDLGGEEIGVSRQEAKKKFESEMTSLHSLNKSVHEITSKADYNGEGIAHHPDAGRLVEIVKQLTVILEKENVKDAQLHVDLLLNRNKYAKLAGSKWQTSPYKKAVLFYRAICKKLEDLMQKSLSLRDTLGQTAADLKDHEYFTTPEANVKTSDVYIPLDGSTPVIAGHITVHQQSDRWFELRKEHVLSASRLYNACGLAGMGKRKEQLNKSFKGVDIVFPDSVKPALEYGCANEINAVATVVGKVLPVYFPKLRWVEAGCFKMDGFDVSCIVSPDGLLIDMNGKVIASVEIKCPYFTKVPHRAVPERYILQVQAEIHATGAEFGLFVSFSPSSTVVYKCKQNLQLLQNAMISLQSNFVPDLRVKLSDLKLENLKHQLRDESQASEYLCEVKSVIHSDTAANIHQDSNKTIVDLQGTVVDCIRYMEDVYQLHRKRATESVTFLLCNSDRVDPGQGHGCEVGYVLTNKQVSIKQYIALIKSWLDKLHELKVCVSVVCFDGEFHRLLTHGMNGEPLTVFSFLRKYWNEVQGMKKGALIEKLELLGATISVKKSPQLVGVVSIGSCTFEVDLELESAATQKQQQTRDSEERSEQELCEQVPSSNYEEALLFLPFGNEIEIDGEETVHGDDDVDELTFNANLNIASLKVSLPIGSKLHSIDDSSLLMILHNKPSLSQTCNVGELKIIIKWLKECCTGLPNSCFYLSGRKEELVSRISQILEFNSPQEVDGCTLNMNWQSLSSKQLAIIFARLKVSSAVEAWLEGKFAASSLPISIGNETFTLKPTLQPEIQQHNCHTMFIEDDHHICSRIRGQLLKNQIEGIRVEGWKRVADRRTTLLTPPIMNGADFQSADFLKITFSEAVEKELLKLDYGDEGTFCSHMRGYMEATDKRGMSAATRVQQLLTFHDWLLSGFDVKCFPPQSRIKGMPTSLVESTVASIEAHIYMYALSPSGSYNVRSLGTNDNESLHAIEFGLCAASGGVPSAFQLQHIKATSRFINSMLMKSSSTIPYRHAKKAKYKFHTANGMLEGVSDNVANNVPDKLEGVVITDHEFDKEQGSSGKKLKGISGWLKPPNKMKGCRGLYKLDESSCMLVDRM